MSTAHAPVPAHIPAQASHPAAAPVTSPAAAVFHRHATVLGRQVFYREAGDPAAPTLLLLHGLPTSSRMFNPLIPLLADRFHVIAPDYIGFGHSDAPSPEDFDYSFDQLAAHVAGLVDLLGLKAYTLYMQDYGGPIGFRLFQQRPEQVTGFIIQNANAYLDGVGDEAKSVLQPLWAGRTPATEAPRATSPAWRERSGTGWSARRTRRASTRTTGSSTRRCWTAPACRRPTSTCWRTTGPTWRSTPNGRPPSAGIARRR
nr:alpha/beta fold hydrolase [Mitsuaria sp. TWR114]